MRDDWLLKAINWWNDNCEFVIFMAAAFVGGMLVGSCVAGAQ
jgi:hypothetical protein